MIVIRMRSLLRGTKKRQAHIRLLTRSYFYVGKNVMWLFQVQINDFFIYPWASMVNSTGLPLQMYEIYRYWKGISAKKSNNIYSLYFFYYGNFFNKNSFPQSFNAVIIGARAFPLGAKKYSTRGGFQDKSPFQSNHPAPIPAIDL